VHRAERGVACISAKRCSLRRGTGRGEGDEGKGEKAAAAAARGESGRRLCEGGVLPY
jgi:hypothetical protein